MSPLIPMAIGGLLAMAGMLVGGWIFNRRRP